MKINSKRLGAVPNKYDPDFLRKVEYIVQDAMGPTALDMDELEVFAKFAAGSPDDFHEFVRQEAERREFEKQTEIHQEKEFKAKQQRLRRRAKSLGIKNWSALWTGFLSAEEILRMERVCAQNRWKVQVACPKYREFASEDGSWEILMDGVTSVSFSPLEIKLLLEKAVHDDAIWPLIELIEIADREFLKGNYTFRSTAHLERCLAGYRWLLENEVPRNGVRLKFARTLMRLPETSRWAALSRYNMTLPYPSVRTVNWEAVELASKNPAFRFECFPTSVQWERLFGFKLPTVAFSRRKQNLLEGLFGGANRRITLIPLLTEIKPSVVRKVCSEVGLPLDASTYDDNKANLSNLVSILNLVYLFKDVQAIKRFVAACGHPWTIKGLHDSGQFSVPVVHETYFTPEKWAPLCLRHPEAVAFTDSFNALEDKGVFPTSLAQLRKEARGLSYPNITPEWEELRDVCLDAGLSGEKYKTYEEFWGSKPQKTAEFLPLAKVCGEEVGLDNSWTFYKLSAFDYRGPLLGLLTGCCQHLDGAGAASARHGVRSPYSGFYVVTHGKKIILQSWAWRTRTGDVVLDSIETINREEENLQPAFKLLEKGIERIVESPLGIERVFIGATNSGVTELFAKKFNVDKTYSSPPKDDCEYFDGSIHILAKGPVPSKKKLTAKKDTIPDVSGYMATKAKPVKHWEPYFGFNAVDGTYNENIAEYQARQYYAAGEGNLYRALYGREDFTWAQA